MNSGHLPAGRAAHGAGTGQGMADMPAERFGAAQGPSGHGGHNGHNGHTNGHHSSRGGGPRRGRHYGNSYNSQHHGPHGQYNQHSQHSQHSQHGQHGQHGQYQQQMYQQAYMPPYGGQQFGYPPQVPFPVMPNMPNYMQFPPPQHQPQQYGRPGAGLAAGLPGQFVPMPAGPMGMHPAQPGVMPLQQPPLPPPQPHAPLVPHAQHPQGLAHAQHVPLVVSPQPPPPQLPPPFSMHGGVVPHQSPPAGLASFPPPPHPAAAMGLPPPLHPHAPLPPRGDVPGFASPNPNPNPNAPATYPSMPPAAEAVGAASSLPPDSTLPTERAATPTQPEDAGSIDRSTVTPSTDAAPTPTSDTDPSTQASGPKTPEPAEAAPLFQTPSTSASEPRARFLPPVPWLSSPNSPFPPRRRRVRRARRDMHGVENVDMPQNQQEAAPPAVVSANAPQAPQTPKAAAASTSATTPTPTRAAVPGSTSTAGSTRASLPVIPALPTRPVASKPSPASPTTAAMAATAAAPAMAEEAAAAPPVTGESVPNGEEGAVAAAAPPAPTAPKLWTGLFAKAAAAGGSSAANGAVTNGHANGTNGGGDAAFPKASANSLAEAVASYRVGSSDQVAFIEPRGLINTGNMCYMNSVLQVLTFCIPFYDFLDQIGQRAAFRFKSETPMIDAMILFLREFRVLDRADPPSLRKRLKVDDLERYGEAFTPEFVYNAINQLPRFSSMIRGHQQDAEEFLGFLLESLNEECAKVLHDAASANGSAPTSGQATPAVSVTSEVPDAVGGGGWLEVGPRQRAAVTRSSGHVSTSPVNSIFSGLLRSELRVPGHKDSVTLEPYQSLQLHIDSPEVRNIVDALRNLTNPEVLHGDFKTPQGKDVNATKQVFLEDLPPVLILHLKRFQFDWKVNGTVKVWKKVGYPLELEIPREIFSRPKRNTLLSKPLPKYQLNAVVYHHGKQASGGHYTVDVLREDGREWIRLDDTVIRRIHRDDVAEAGAEETGHAAASSSSSNSSNVAASAAAAAAATAAQRDASSAKTGSANRFAGIDDEVSDNEGGWSTPVNGSGKKWSAVANGATSPKNKPPPKDTGIKDNKVAYLLFYQRVN